MSSDAGCDAPCDGVEARLVDAFLAHREPADDDAAHAGGCAACGTLRAELRALAGALEAQTPPPLRPELAEALRRRSLEELARAEPAGALPPGFRHELLRLLGWAVAPLPVLAIWYALLIERGRELLASFLPEAAVLGIGFVFVAGTLSWLGAIYGAIPFVAHHRARRRWEERAA